jgi:hypothetical protein
VRLAARIVDTPCNEMDTDIFLEVGGSVMSGEKELGWGVCLDPKQSQKKPGGCPCSNLLIPGAAFMRLCGIPHSSRPGSLSKGSGEDRASVRPRHRIAAICYRKLSEE